MVEEIKKDLESLLSEYRYNHCLRVGETAASLAKHYKINAEEAYLAGLTHDIAKEFTMEENEQFIKEHNLDENLLDPKNKKFIHGIVGAVLVREKYHFNKDMFNAIYYHTTGRPNMSDLEKIVYLADKIEPGKNYQGIEEERRLAYQDLDKAVILCLETKIKKLTSEGKLLFFISPTIFAFKSVFVVLTICPTTLSFPSSNITCKSTKFACLARSIVKLTKTLLSTISLISPNIYGRS